MKSKCCKWLTLALTTLAAVAVRADDIGLVDYVIDSQKNTGSSATFLLQTSSYYQDGKVIVSNPSFVKGTRGSFVALQNQDPKTSTSFAINSKLPEGYCVDKWVLSTKIAGQGKQIDSQEGGDSFTVEFDYKWKSEYGTYLELTVYIREIEYTVSYHANGGTISPDPETVTYKYFDTVTAESSGILTRNGYTATGWNTRSNGDGSAIDFDEEFTAADLNITEDGQSITLYAQWSIARYDFELVLGTGIDKIYYKVNGASTYTATAVDTTIKVEYNSTWYMYATAKPGYTHTETSADKPATGTMGTAKQSFKKNASPNTIYVSYDGNGATGSSTDMKDSTFTYDVESSLRLNTYLRSYKVTYSRGVRTAAALGRESENCDYKFTKWNNAADGKGTYSYTDGAKVANVCGSYGNNANDPVVLYAQWQSASVTLPTASCTGYDFLGWYDGTKYAGKTGDTYLPTGNVTLTAKWSDAKSYKVTLNKNGGACSELTSYTYGVGATLPVATKTGYTFNGWYDNANFTGSAVTKISATETGDKTFWAKFTVNTYKVTLNKNGGTCSDLTSYTYGVGATLPVATKTGHTFNGWYDNKSFTGSAIAAISKTDTGDKVFYAKFTANTYKVTLNKNGGTCSELTSYTYGVGATLPTVTREGYTSDGWYANENFTGSAVTKISATETGDKVFWAKLTVNSYPLVLNLSKGLSRIFYQINGASYYEFTEASTTVQVNYGTRWYVYAEPSLGYALSGNCMACGTMGTSGYVFNPNAGLGNYKLTLTKGTGIDKISYKIGDVKIYTTVSASTKVDVPYTKTWYAYATAASGYTHTTSASKPATGVMTAEGAEFAPVGTPCTYTVTLNKNGGTCSDLTSYTYGVGATLPVATKTGYTFNGWYDNASFSGSAVTAISTTATGNKTFYAKFTASQYNLALTVGTGIDKIYYKVNGASTFTAITASTTVKVNYGTTWYAYATAKTGYTYSATSAASPKSDTMGTAGATFAPVATVNQYDLKLTVGTGIAKIYYKVNGAGTYSETTSTKTIDVNYGTTWYAYAVAASGYTYTATSADHPQTGTMTTAGATFTATASANTYTITISAGEGGEGGSTASYTYSASRKEITITLPTKVGYKLDGWTATGYAGSVAPSISGTVLTIPANTSGNFTMTPTWKVNQYDLALTKGTGIDKLYYKVNGAVGYTEVSASTTVKVNYGTTWYAYATAKTGYTYNATTAAKPATGTMTTAGATFTATATVDQYNLALTVGTGIDKIYYKVNGASTFTAITASTTVKVNYGTTWYAYATAKTGYTYSATSAASPKSDTMGTAGATFAPVATVNQYDLKLTVGTGIAKIYYKVNGAGTYSETTSTKTIDVNYGTTWYAYAVAANGYTYTATSAAKPATGTMGVSGATFTATASANSYTITISAGDGGEGGSTASYTYSASRKEITITLPTKVGYKLDGWTATGYAGSVAPSISGTVLTIPANTSGNFTMTPTWKVNQYDLALTKGTGIDKLYYKVNGAVGYTEVSASTTVKVNYGTTWYAYATAKTGYAYTATSAAKPATGTMTTAGATFTATATVIQYNLALTVGTGIDKIYYKVNGASTFTAITASTTVKVNYGTTWYAYATAKTGYTYSATSAANPKSGKMDTEGAVFAPVAEINTYTISVSVDPSGTGTVTGGGKYNHGATATLKATPNTGYKFVRWTDGELVAERTVTVTASKSYTAEFEPLTYTITISAGEGGEGGSTTNYTYSTDRKDVEITLPTKKGYTLDDWTATGYVGSYAPSINGNILSIHGGTSGDFTMTPTWVVNKYKLGLVVGDGIDKICYKVNGASVYTDTGTTKEVDVTYGTTWYAYATAKEGYVYTETSAESPTNGVMTTDGAVFAPVGRRNVYSIKFAPGADSVINPTAQADIPDCAKDKGVELPTCVYTNLVSCGIVGWKYNGTTYKEGDEFVYPDGETSSEITMTAVWQDSCGELSAAVGLTNAVLRTWSEGGGKTWKPMQGEVKLESGNIAGMVSVLGMLVKGSGKLHYKIRSGDEDGQNISFYNGSTVETKIIKDTWQEEDVDIMGSDISEIGWSVGARNVAVEIKEITWTPEEEK